MRGFGGSEGAGGRRGHLRRRSRGERSRLGQAERSACDDSEQCCAQDGILHVGLHFLKRLRCANFNPYTSTHGERYTDESSARTGGSGLSYDGLSAPGQDEPTPAGLSGPTSQPGRLPGSVASPPGKPLIINPQRSPGRDSHRTFGALDERLSQVLSCKGRSQPRYSTRCSVASRVREYARRLYAAPVAGAPSIGQ